jgi:ethanolamine kinase
MVLPQARKECGPVRFIPLAYDSLEDEKDDTHPSARKLILALAPEWDDKGDSSLKFVRFTDGITNTLLKVVKHRPGLTKAALDQEAILLRAYGKGTAILIDRDREAENHELLMKYDLAPALLARFKNGMLYRYISGTVANHNDLRESSTLRAIARRLAQWHATVPCLHDPVQTPVKGDGTHAQLNGSANKAAIATTAPGKPPPNVWTTMHKWILALPTDTRAERERQALLLREMKQLVAKLSERPGLGQNGVMSPHTISTPHCIGCHDPRRSLC